MGEMADLEVDRMIEQGMWFRPSGRSRAYGPPLTCKGCGSPDVFWQRVFDKVKRESGYRMHDTATLELHSCPLPANTPDGFEDC